MWQIKWYVERMLEPWPDNAIVSGALVFLIGIGLLWILSSRTR